MYLAIDNENGEETIIEELRAKNGDIVTVAEFTIIENAGKIANLNFYEISEDEIFSNFNQLCYKFVAQILNNGKMPSEKEVRIEANITLGKKLLATIANTIFIPLEKLEDESAELKEKAYASFHILAAYFEKRGFVGIIYPSTRMMLKGKTGTNLVLFNVESARICEKTIHSMILRER